MYKRAVLHSHCKNSLITLSVELILKLSKLAGAKKWLKNRNWPPSCSGRKNELIHWNTYPQSFKHSRPSSIALQYNNIKYLFESQCYKPHSDTLGNERNFTFADKTRNIWLFTAAFNPWSNFAQKFWRI